MTRRRLILTAPVYAALAMLAGCVTDPLTAFNQAWNKDAKGTVTPVTDAQTIQIRVPKDKGIHPLSLQAGTFLAVRDLVYVDQVVKNGPVSYAAQVGQILRVEVAGSNPSSFSRLLYEDPQSGSFSISITANFMRSQAVQRLQGSYRDPVTGKIISTAYQMPMNGPMGDTVVAFTVNAYPYRNGSKAVINALIPGKQTSAGVLDFRALTGQVKSTITAIVES